MRLAHAVSVASSRGRLPCGDSVHCVPGFRLSRRQREPFVPPPQYRVWWEVVEACSGRRAPFDAVAWFKVPVGELVVRGETAAGAWFVFGNRIAIVDAWLNGDPLVRHEMLHAILETGDHPKEYFQRSVRRRSRMLRT